MKTILDACCGSRMFWFDKENPNVDFCDIRTLDTTLCDGRSLKISPDIICDFTNLPMKDNTYYLVVFDPPHLIHVGNTSWLAQKYGKLSRCNWKDTIKRGFDECMRVLKPNGVLIFKWSETDIKTSEIISVIHKNPLFGHKSGKRENTHWMCFMKEVDENCRYFKNKSNVVEVVRCKDCIYFQDRYVELPDGSKNPYKKSESSVPLSVGINVGSYCTRIDYAIVHGYRHGEPSVDETRLWTKPDDFCSYGERKDEE